jgi:catechol 2,3-dioxygenase-like lactoylglutathione lyase family enzyme
MLTHITIGFDNVDEARAFYDHIMEPLGYSRAMDHGDMSAYGPEGGRPQFMILKPRDGNAATHANGGTIGLIAPTRAAVNEFHRRALEKGGKDEGAPGPRPFGENFYAAYIRDIGGHKICVTCTNPE